MSNEVNRKLKNLSYYQLKNMYDILGGTLMNSYKRQDGKSNKLLMVELMEKIKMEMFYSFPENNGKIYEE
jgi:hypothetical protein